MRSRRDVLRDAKIGIIEVPSPNGPAQSRNSPAKAGRPPADLASRRAFITISVAATGGLLVAMRTEPLGAQMQMAAPTGPLSFPGHYIQIDPDDRVLIWCAQPEMGEGTKTSLPMLVAEELDADWSRVRVEFSTTDRKYGGQGVGGSDAIRSDWDNLRRSARRRALLVSAAAAQWACPPPNAMPQRTWSDTPPGREAPYGSLAAARATLTVRAVSRSRIPRGIG